MAPRVSRSFGSSRASLSHSVSLPAWTCAALEIVEGDRRAPVLPVGTGRRWLPARWTAVGPVAPSPQVTTEFGCTLTGPAGSTPVTVSSSEVQVMPTAMASAALAADVDVPGPRSRGSSETVSPTVITLPSSASRRVAGDTDCGGELRTRSPSPTGRRTRSPARRSPWRPRADPALDSVTSSSRAVPAGVLGRCDARRPRRWCATRSATPHPIPECPVRQRLPDAAGPHRAGVSSAEVFSRAVSLRWPSGGSSSAVRFASLSGPGLRRPSRAIDRRCGCARRLARRAARRCCGLSSHASGRAATQRWLRIVNGMMHR